MNNITVAYKESMQRMLCMIVECITLIASGGLIGLLYGIITQNETIISTFSPVLLFILITAGIYFVVIVVTSCIHVNYAMNNLYRHKQ